MSESHDPVLEDYERRKAAALAMGGPDRLARRAAAGLLNARERVEHLCDAGTFVESGLFGESASRAEDRGRTPADGKVAGFGHVDGRRVGVVANDFTVMGASSSSTNGKKMGHVKRVATQRGFPMVFLGESSGARMPDHMGSRGMGSLLGQDGTQYLRLRETPWASATLGPLLRVVVVVLGAVGLQRHEEGGDHGGLQSDARLAGGGRGGGTRRAGRLAAPFRGHRVRRPGGRHRPTGHRRDQTFPVISAVASLRATARRGGPRRLRDGDGEHRRPRSGVAHPGLRRATVVETIVDHDSFFELKPRFGKTAVTGLARLDGRTVGVVANNPISKGGAMDTDGCDKITSFLVLCDSFNVPIVMLVDTPGFVIGTDAERRRAPGKIMNMMNALSLVTVPKLSVILRKSYGQAYLNMGGGRNSDEVIAWPTAEVSFMTPQFGVKIVHGLDPGDPGYDEALESMSHDSEVWDMASIYAVQSVIRPDETRDHLIALLDVHRSARSGGVGQHLMASWPTSY